MNARTGIIKELHNLLGDIAKFTENQCTILDILEKDKLEETVKFTVGVKPNSGPYQGGKFDFCVEVSQLYPAVPPNILCLTQVYHPNIDESGQICLSLLDDWSIKYNTLHDCIYGLLFLFKHPNLDEPLSPIFCPNDNMEKYSEKVRKSLEGSCVEGFQFPRNLANVSESAVSDQTSNVTKVALNPDQNRTTVEELLPHSV